jgi:hypothetical protein
VQRLLLDKCQGFKSGFMRQVNVAGEDLYADLEDSPTAPFNVTSNSLVARAKGVENTSSAHLHSESKGGMCRAPFIRVLSRFIKQEPANQICCT